MLSYLALTSAAWPDWIEAYGVAPDGGNGSLEWGVSIVLMAVCLVVSLLVRRNWRIGAENPIGT